MRRLVAVAIGVFAMSGLLSAQHPTPPPGSHPTTPPPHHSGTPPTGTPPPGGHHGAPPPHHGGQGPHDGNGTWGGGFTPGSSHHHG